MRNKLKYLGLLFAVALAGAVAAVTAVLRHGLSARDEPSVVETVLAKTARSSAVPSGAKHWVNPLPNTPENLTQAAAHWANHCASCHANNGSGDTVIGKNLYPRAPDMRLIDTQSKSDGELYYTIENGIRLTGMPAWGDGGDRDVETWKLVWFIRHLPQLSVNEERKMERLNPKTEDERAEEEAEERFLNSGEVPSSTNAQQHHHL